MPQQEALAGGVAATLTPEEPRTVSHFLLAALLSQWVVGHSQIQVEEVKEGTVWVAGAGGGMGEMESISGGLIPPHDGLSGDGI